MTVVQMAESAESTVQDTRGNAHGGTRGDARADAHGNTRGRDGGRADRGPSSAENDCARAEGLPRPDGQDQYTISEVAHFTGLSAHTLRWYERIGLMPHVDRSHTGQRRFSNRDLDWLAFVGKLRLTGMPVADMVSYAEMVRAGQQTFAQRRALLESTRTDVLRRIAELQDTLAVLDRKIDTYGACLVPGRTSA